MNTGTIKRMPTLIAVFDSLLFISLGLVYAWSVFVEPLEAEFHWARNETSLTFTICMAMFCIGGFVAAQLSKRIKPQLIGIAAGILLLVGFWSASNTSQILHMHLAYGGLCGFSIGMAYNVLLSTANRWFQNRPGFIAGLLLMSFGFGGMLLGSVATFLMDAYGWRITFRILGSALCVMLIAFSPLFRLPPKGSIAPAAGGKKHAAGGLELKAGQMLGRPSFWTYAIWTVLITSLGLMLIGHAKPLLTEMHVEGMSATILAGLVSVANGGGRILFGSLYDIVGRRWTMTAVSICCLAGSILAIAAFQTGWIPLLAISFVLIGLSYGGAPATNSNFIMDFYGRQNYPVNFSVINFSLLLASFLGPFLAGSLYQMSGNYTGMLVCFIAFALVSIGSAQFLKKA